MDKPLDRFEIRPYLKWMILIGLVWYSLIYLALSPKGGDLYNGSILWLVCMMNFWFLTKGVDSTLTLVSEYKHRQTSVWAILEPLFWGFLKLNSLILLGWLLYQWRSKLSSSALIMGLGVCALVPLLTTAIWSWQNANGKGN